MDAFHLPFEMHIFQVGRYGMSVNNRLTQGVAEVNPSVTMWVPLCIAWLDQLFNE